MTDQYNLERFVAAQANSYERAFLEIKGGAKRTHWMWFIFPQIAGLGSSTTAQFYAISSIAEAQAYLAHPLLGERILACVEALQDLTGTTAESVFGNVDAMKLRSSLTLFVEAGADQVFEAALRRWFRGEADAATLKLLSA